MKPFKNAGVQVQEYVYDFAVDGGAQGTIVLSDKDNVDPLPIGAVLKGVTALVLTSVTSLGSATMEWGTSDDTDGYSGAAIAKATLVANYVQNGWTGAGALVWDDTNDVQLYPAVTSAATGSFVVKINTADLTAGKIVFVCEYLYPMG